MSVTVSGVGLALGFLSVKTACCFAVNISKKRRHFIIVTAGKQLFWRALLPTFERSRQWLPAWEKCNGSYLLFTIFLAVCFGASGYQWLVISSEAHFPTLTSILFGF